MAQGARFPDAYAGYAVCAPSHTGLMTGRHATGFFGKWGLGGINTPGVPWKDGFGEVLGFPPTRHVCQRRHG